MTKSEVGASMTDAEWEARFNGPREALLKEIFGDKPCPIKDLSPTTRIKDENWEKGKSFMVEGRPRIYKNPNTEGVAEMNAQLQATGRIERKLSAEDLAKDNKAKPEPVK